MTGFPIQPTDFSGSSIRISETLQLTPVGLDRRLLNFILDGFCGYSCYAILSIYFLLLADRFPVLNTWYGYLDNIHPILIGVVEKLVPMFFYYLFCEWLYYGRTFGKWMTNTRAVKTDGRFLTFRDALMRSFTRLVPLETISYFIGSKGFWHDVWSKTIVIQDKS